MKRFFKDPLLHFTLLGAAVFAAYGYLSEPEAREPGEIVITMGEVENLAAVFARSWQRPPTPDELAGLVRERVREEIYCREAIALGLDQDDTVIRRRLRQKMEFISDDLAAQVEATDAELDAYLKSNPEQFRIEPRFTFRQVFLDPDKHGDPANVAALRLRQLNREDGAADLSPLSDSFMLESGFDDEPADQIAKQFGTSFASKLGELPLGVWNGPVESGYGWHLVKIVDRTVTRPPELAEVRNAVHREWSNARRMAANEAFYQKLLGRYRVTIEQPADPCLATAP